MVVVGGGISGLVAAYRLSEAGVAVTLLESSHQLGGLGTFFENDGTVIERFYHCTMPTDGFLHPLLEELGLLADVEWRETTMGMVVDGIRYPFNSAVDLLKFSPLTPLNRIRFGAVSVLLRFLGRGKDLDNLRTEDWLRQVYGDVIWDRLLQPMFGAKFGDAFGDVPARYLFERLGRESNVATRGYPRGGYKSIIDALRAAIELNGGAVRTDAKVISLSSGTTGATVELAGGEVLSVDGVIATVPLPALRAMADADLQPKLPTTDLRYQGVVNALLFLDRPLDGHYWAPVLHSDTDFDGVVEMSALTGTERYDGKYLVYVMKYCDRDSPLFAEAEEAIAERWTGQLCRLFPGVLARTDVAGVRVFKAPFVEPVYPLGYRAPDIEIADSDVFLATTAQIYPDVTSWNSSVGLANQVVERVLGRLAADSDDAGVVPFTGGGAS